MRQDGYFDRVLVKKETENGQWVLYQISTIRPHLNGISDRILCASCGLDALMILNDAKIGAELELKGCETNIRSTCCLNATVLKSYFTRRRINTYRLWKIAPKRRCATTSSAPITWRKPQIGMAQNGLSLFPPIKP